MDKLGSAILFMFSGLWVVVLMYILGIRNWTILIVVSILIMIFGLFVYSLIWSSGGGKND